MKKLIVVLGCVAIAVIVVKTVVVVTTINAYTDEYCDSKAANEPAANV